MRSIIAVLLTMVCLTFICVSARALDIQQAKEDILYAFREYQLALKTEDYSWALGLEPLFMQVMAEGEENYKTWWSGTPSAESGRNFMIGLKPDYIQLMTPKRGYMAAKSPEVEKEIIFYVMFDRGAWRFAFIDVITPNVKRKLDEIKEALTHFYNDYGELPRKLSTLVPDYLGTIPVDPFNGEGEVYRYIQKENGSFILYSFGPDSDDDRGKKYYNAETGFFSDGDIVVEN